MVLVVEDDVSIQVIVEDALKEAGLKQRSPIQPKRP